MLTYALLVLSALTTGNAVELAVGTIVPGETAVLELHDAPAGETTHFFATATALGAGACAPAVPFVCHELDNAVTLGTAIVDSQGVARLEVPVPTTVADGSFLAFQAGWTDPVLGTGEGSEPVIRFVGVPADACGDGLVDALGGEACDDGNEVDGDTCSATCDTQTCLPGFEGDGITCTDIDECATGTDTCDPWATCANTSGAHTCACGFGMLDTFGDGSVCEPPPNSGVCQLQQIGPGGTPNFGDDPVAPGYAIYYIEGVNNVAGLRSACTDEIMEEVREAYCTMTSSPAQRKVVTYQSNGGIQSVGCVDSPCENMSCP